MKRICLIFKNMTGKYPNAKLILANFARGFASWTVIEAVRQMKGIPDVYYDMAAICDAATMCEVIRQAGAEHVMWCSDYSNDRTHGKPVNGDEGFRWLYNGDDGFSGMYDSTESLFAFYHTSLVLDLTNDEIKMIFYGTVCSLYGLQD